MSYKLRPLLLTSGDLTSSKEAWSLPSIVLPLVTVKDYGPLDELYPSPQNLFSVAVHGFLLFAQSMFLLSIPIALFSLVPLSIVVSYIVGIVVANRYLCRLLLSGWKPSAMSTADLSHFGTSHPDESWIFLNGVAVGRHWLQSNIDRIALSFGRPVLGTHNPSNGIIFDLFMCLIQRDFCYATEDIRAAFSTVKDALSKPNIKKVIFISHSQGGLEASLILDWLLADMPEELLGKLEIYTFGNAANHFNNPERKVFKSPASAGGSQATGAHPSWKDDGVFRHIEHYANEYDFVSRMGVLNFVSWTANPQNRFKGSVFKQRARGHLLNQHYMDRMFPLRDDGEGLKETNDFIETEATVDDGPRGKRGRVTVGDVSRLWEYRNGRSPKD